MSTETTNIIDIGRGMIFFDAGCGFCAAGARRAERLLARRGFRMMPLQSPDAEDLTGATLEALMREAHLVTPDEPRRVLRGVDAVLYVAAAIPWAAPLRWLALLPGGKPLLRVGYRWFAARRHRLSAACGLPNRPMTARPGAAPRAFPLPSTPGRGQGRGAGGAWSRVVADSQSRHPPRHRIVRARPDDQAGRWAPPAAWLAMALLAGPYLPAWAWMWLVAFALFFGCKWATWWPYRFAGSAARRAGFLFAYAGMDAKRFLAGPPVPPPPAREWLATGAKAVAGAALLWLGVRLVFPTSALLAGWVAMAGLALLLHFGLLDLFALAWRTCGVDARPLMRCPTRATSVADFWGNRWNTGFRALAHDFVFEPLRRVRGLGPTGASAAVFLASGAVHDLVISVPARGGYGLPTLYFCIQFAALTLERTKPMRRTFARRPLLGRLFAVAVTLAPLPLLFHEAFVDVVILPFLHTIGGLP